MWSTEHTAETDRFPHAGWSALRAERTALPCAIGPRISEDFPVAMDDLVAVTGSRHATPGR